MSTIVRALETMREPARLWYAAHEVGHGVVFLKAGFRPRLLELTTGFFGGLKGGYCHIGTHEVPDHQFKYYAAGVLAGQAGQARFGQIYLRMSAEEALVWAAEHAGNDSRYFDSLCREHGIRVQRRWAYRQAERVVWSSGARFDRLTLRLAKSGRLSGGAL